MAVFLIPCISKGRLTIGIVTPMNLKRTNGLIDARLSRLERTVDKLVSRLDAEFNGLVNSYSNHTRATTTASAADGNSAPVFLLRDAATDAGVHSPETSQTRTHVDVISTGLVSMDNAHSLVEL